MNTTDIRTLTTVDELAVLLARAPQPGELAAAAAQERRREPRADDQQHARERERRSPSSSTPRSTSPIPTPANVATASRTCPARTTCISIAT